MAGGVLMCGYGLGNGYCLEMSADWCPKLKLLDGTYFGG